MENYNERLKNLRKENKITQQTIADILKITREQYHLYESGKRELPIKLLIILCQYYGVTSDYILGINV